MRTALAISRSEVTSSEAGRRRIAVVVTAAGEVDVSNRASFVAAVARAADSPIASLLLLDLTRVAHIDSAGLSAAVASLRRAADAGWSVAVIVDAPWMMRRCAITGVDQEVAVFTTLDAALTSGALSWGSGTA